MTGNAGDRSARPTAPWRAAALLAAAAACTLAGHGATRDAAAQQPDDAFIDRVVASLTIDERVGQLVMVNFVGADTTPESDIAGLVRDFKVGAVLVTASNGNIVNRGDTPAQIAGLANALQQRAFDANHRLDGTDEYFIPLLIATDNEGDLFPFTNVTNGYTAVPNNMTIGATWSKEHAKATGDVVGLELSSAGINMLLGPAVDVLAAPRSGGDGDIGIRSFGGNAAWVGALGRAYVDGVHDGGGGKIMVVAKHFPGHGGSDRSTDAEAPTVNKSLDQLRRSDLVPFAQAARIDEAHASADAMMVSHIRYRSLQAGGAEPFTDPISLDAPAFKALMGLPEFAAWRAGHLVMSDSLGVPAVKKWYAQQGEAEFPNRTVVRDALLAGSDLLPLVEFYRDPAQPGWKNNQLPTIQDSIIYMREQYAADADFRRRADEALRHVLAAKLRMYPKLRLDDVRVDAAQASAVAGEGEAEMTALAEDALTLIHPQSVDELRARLPRGPQAPDRVLIVECWADCYPYRIMPKARLQDDLLRLYGPSGKGRIKREDVSTISFAELDAWLSAPDDPANAAIGGAVNDAAWVIFALTEYNPNGRPASGAVKRFLDRSPVDVRNKNLVAISYNSPYHLDSTEISKLSAYFAVYSKTQAAIDTGFRALFGEAEPRGHSPVDISGVFYSVAEATQPDPAQTIEVRVFGSDEPNVGVASSVALVTGPLVDRNGSAVPDGTSVTFALSGAGGQTSTVATTVDGFAGAQVATSGAGDYTATASVAGIVSKPLALTVAEGAPPQAVEPEPEPASGSGGDTLTIVAIAGGAAALALVAGGAFGATRFRRRALPASAAVGASGGGIAVAMPAAAGPLPPPERELAVDTGSRRVHVKGTEIKPPLSNEQFRLLSYLFERHGRVVGREELVMHVWPDAHAEGVSEEALDALVRRVRERIVQAGGERSYIVTLRGQGFRLEA